MGNRSVHLDDFNEALISLSKYRKNNFSEKDINHKKMLSSLKNIIQGELTQKQRMCLLLYYGEKMKMREISLKLGICVSSVSRHIKKGKQRIKKTMEYYF